MRPAVRLLPLSERLFCFAGGDIGPWRVTAIDPIAGETLATVKSLDVLACTATPQPRDGGWLLRGATSNERYVERAERERLVDAQPLSNTFLQITGSRVARICGR